MKRLGWNARIAGRLIVDPFRAGHIMQCLKRCLAGVCAVFLLLLALAIAAAFGVRDWLAAGEAPQRADLILVLAGHFSRPLYAADLYRARMAPRILLSVERRSAEELLLDKLDVPFPKRRDVAGAVLTKRGVPESAFAYFDAEAQSTLDEAESARRMLSGTSDTFLIVTSAYHARRVEMIFADVFPRARFRVVASPYESFADPWWRDQDSARNVLLEVAKILYYRLGGGFRAPQH
jgi:uncharacterized SAM-binding protein YcdF (DUF218 family)